MDVILLDNISFIKKLENIVNKKFLLIKMALLGLANLASREQARSKGVVKLQ